MTKQYTKYPESLNVALELTKMIVNYIDDIPNTGNSNDLKENPENTILNIFERCLHVANDGHARTTFLAQNDDTSQSNS